MNKLEKEFEGKRWHIQHEHHVGNGMVISSGGGKTKEFLEWEEELEKMQERKEI